MDINRSDTEKVWLDYRSNLKAFLKEDLQQGFSANGKALCRFHCIRMNATHYELIITSHHSLFDGRSRRILIQDFLELKESKSQNKRLKKVSYPSISLVKIIK